MNLQGKKIGFGLTGSHCTYAEAVKGMKQLLFLGAEVTPFVTDSVKYTSTRFGEAEKWVKTLEELTGKKVIDTIFNAEPFGAKFPLDCMVIAPATGATISKIASAQFDNAVLTGAKATLRNLAPLVVAVSTNDGLGLSGVNIMKLLATKNIYLVPFGQDDPQKKPNSLVFHANFIGDTVIGALKGKQHQPVLESFRL